MALAQRGNGLADAVQPLQVFHKGFAQRGGQVARGAAGLTEVIHVHITLDVAAVVGAAAVLERAVAARVDGLAGLELDLAAVVQARDAAEGEH